MESAVKMQVTLDTVYAYTQLQTGDGLKLQLLCWQKCLRGKNRTKILAEHQFRRYIFIYIVLLSGSTYCQIHSHCIGVEWKKNSFMYKNTVWFAVCMFSTSIELLFIWLIKTKARCRMNPSMESTATQICFRRRVEHTYFFWLLMFPCLHLKILT